VRSMRSGTYVHQGEHLSCAGCHEDKWQAESLRPHCLRSWRGPCCACGWRPPKECAS
jgi:hypothetical protein